MIIHSAAHWLVLISFIALAGALTFPLIGLRSDAAHALVDATMAARRRWLAGWLIACASASVLFWLTGPGAASDGRATALTLARLALLAVIGLMLWRRVETSGLALMPAALLLLTQSLLSRSAALPDWLLPTLTDWFHLALTAPWLGGVAFLAFVLIPPVLSDPSLLGAFSAAVDRFSPLALFCVLGLGISGIVQASAFIRDLSELVSTDYGRALSVKLILVVVLIGFGALHQQVIAPRLRLWRLKAARAEAERATLRFRASLFAEVAASAVLLLAVGVMKALPLN